jgi:nucleotide-binding universal stress UspA family protein
MSDLGRLMPFAIQQAAVTGARLLLVHVLSPSVSMAVDSMGMPYYDPVAAHEFAGKSLQPWRTMARNRGIACDVIIREGVAAQQISACARQFQADRILLGTRSRSKLSKLLLGSVAEQVLRSVNLPVMTVGPEAHLPVDTSDSEKVVLYATTLREDSRPSAVLACQIALSQGACFVLLHVLPHPDDQEKRHQLTALDSAATQQLQSLAELMNSGETRNAKVASRLVHGNPSIEILAMASELNATLIVLGATQRSALQNLTRDRTIYRILAHARCPVLTLREESPTTTPSEVDHLAYHA